MSNTAVQMLLKEAENLTRAEKVELIDSLTKQIESQPGKIGSHAPMIEAVGAQVICLSPYSPDFNHIELWWSQLKSFLRRFSPTTTEMVDGVISVALNLMNPKHLRNWFSNCCYCTS